MHLIRLAAIAAVAVFTSGAHAQNSTVSKCDSLKSVAFPGLVVTEAKIVPAGSVEPTPDGSEGPAPAFQHMHFGTSPTAANNSADALLGFGSLKYYAMTPPDPQFDPMHFDFDRDTARIIETSKLNDADAAFLQSFASHGKLILYHGMSDQGLSPLDTAAWYDRLQSTTGGRPSGQRGNLQRGRTQDWARLFLVPGMTHCGGGPATDEFDMLTAIQSWVEEGHAPDRIVARGKTFPGVTRPLCPYPQIARYTGS